MQSKCNKRSHNKTVDGIDEFSAFLIVIANVDYHAAFEMD